MRLPIAAVAFSFAAIASAGASPAPAAAHMPAQKAFDTVHEGPAEACMNAAHLSQTAYTPSAEHPLRCSELLSTDTLMKIHHWDRT